jgi:hypothetical protein
VADERPKISPLPAVGVAVMKEQQVIMRVTIATAVVLSVVIAATPALAWHFSPSGSFTADGKISMIKNGSHRPACNAHLTGTVDDSGIAHFTGGSFTDITTTDCGQLKPANLPWKGVAKRSKRAKVMNVTIDVQGTAYCGPSTVPVTLKSGVIGFAAVPMAGGCSVSGHLSTSPALLIVP